MTDKFKLLEVQASPTATKKWTAVFSDGTKTRRVSFGAKGMDDYTLKHDKEQRERYRARHAKDLQRGTPMSPGYLSYYLLWGDSTDLQTNVRAYRKRFGL
jgi:hypothetical protein